METSIRRMDRYEIVQIKIICSTGAVVMVWLTIQQSKDAYDKKKITDDDLNQAVGRLFGFRLVRSFLSCT